MVGAEGISFRQKTSKVIVGTAVAALLSFSLFFPKQLASQPSAAQARTKSDSLSRIGDSFYNNYEFEKALPYYKEAIGPDERLGNGQIFYRMFRIISNIDTSRAVGGLSDHYERLFVAYTVRANDSLEMANKHLASGDYGAAIKEYEQALRLDPDAYGAKDSLKVAVSALKNGAYKKN
jgi:tetratricopeptide (TPR) repeat protein